MTASLSKEGLKSVPLSVQMHLLIIRVAACGHPWSSLNYPKTAKISVTVKISKARVA